MSAVDAGSSSKRQRRQYWWDIGVVAAAEGEVKVALMGSHRPAIVTLTAGIHGQSGGKFPHGMNFAVVGTKLYGFGGYPVPRIRRYKEVYDYPLDLFVCQLPPDPENYTSKPLPCEAYLDKLRGPKTTCIHVPYKQKKLIMLATRYDPLLGNQDRKCPAPCEVLHLKDLTMETVDTPFWVWDESLCSYPTFHGYVVVGSSLYVHVGDLFRPLGLHCLDMSKDKLQWIPVDDGSSAMSMLYWQNVYIDSHCSNVVHKGSFFQMRQEGPDHRHTVFVKHTDGGEDHELGPVSDFLRKRSGSIEGVAVVPFEDDDDDNLFIKFCAFTWFRQGFPCYFDVCKFGLVDNYDCGDPPLCSIFYECSVPYEFLGNRFTAFTPASYIVMASLYAF